MLNRIIPAGAGEGAAKAASSKPASQRPYAAGQGGTWVDAASKPLSPSKSGAREPQQKPFATGAAPGWREAASEPM